MSATSTVTVLACGTSTWKSPLFVIASITGLATYLPSVLRRVLPCACESHHSSGTSVTRSAKIPSSGETSESSYWRAAIW